MADVSANVVQITAISTLKDSVRSMISMIDRFALPFYSITRKERAYSDIVEHTEDSVPDSRVTESGVKVVPAVQRGADLEPSAVAHEVRKWTSVQAIHRSWKVALEADRVRYEVNVGTRTARAMIKERLGHVRLLERLCIGQNQGPQKATVANKQVSKCPSYQAMAGVQSKHASATNGGWGTNTYSARTESGSNQRALTAAIFDAHTKALKAKTDNVLPRTVFAEDKQKAVIAGFTSNVPNRNNINLPAAQTLVNKTVDVIKTVHGDLYNIRYNRFVREEDVITYNSSMAAIKNLYLNRIKKMPESGYYSWTAIGSNVSLCLHDDDAHGLISDLS